MIVALAAAIGKVLCTSTTDSHGSSALNPNLRSLASTYVEPDGTVNVEVDANAGGCAVPRDATWWNLYYRFSPDVHGHGLATELAQLAIGAAHGVDPERPVVAFLLEHNHASKRTAERAGLHLVWRGPDVGSPDPNSVRLIYAAYSRTSAGSLLASSRAPGP